MSEVRYVMILALVGLSLVEIMYALVRVSG